jgi:hypothetical protein
LLKSIPTIAVLTAALSAGSWTYRFIDDYLRSEELLFYILIPAGIWALFAGSLFLLRHQRQVIRVTAALLLLPTSLLWILSVLVGLYGLKIH